MNKVKIYKLIKKTYGIFLTCSHFCFGINFTKRMDARLRFHRKLNLRNPKTLADKVSYISIHALPKLATRCTDKWEVRGYIAEKGLEHILIPVHGEAVSSTDDLDFSVFPDRFVLKATHGCRMNYICVDKSQLDQKACKEKVRQWLDTTYGTYSVEPHYRSIPHRVYCETCIEKPELIVDYKILCMNGEPSFFYVCSDRKNEEGKGNAMSMYLYDTQWNPIDGLQSVGSDVVGVGDIPKPKKLDEMLEIARKLSEEFDFVRVDLYETNGKVWFGELTFTPANGVFPYFKQEFLETEGKKLIISPCKK